MTKLKILVVEDDERIAGLFEAILQGSGYTVFTVADSAHALSLIHKDHKEIDLLICDVLLGADHGPTLALRLQRLCPGMATIFISGFPFDILCEKGLLRTVILDDTAISYIQKPFFPKDLLRMVDCALARRKSLVQVAAAN